MCRSLPVLLTLFALTVTGCDHGVSPEGPDLDRASSATRVVVQPTDSRPTPPGDEPGAVGDPSDPDPYARPSADPVDILDPNQLIVHEWGTFVSMVNPAGWLLEGMHHEEEPLPNFVFSRCAEVPWCSSAYGKQMELLPGPVTQKLETPVLYFYTSEPKTITVDVAFPQGIISQWYPDATEMQPMVGWDLDEMANGAMTWQVDVDPNIDVDLAPWVPEDHIWAPSRNVAATPLAVDDQVESFIFYRGLGRFTLPIKVLNDGVAVHVDVKGPNGLPSVWLLNVRDGLAAITSVGTIDGYTTADIQIPTPKLPMADFIAQAKDLVAQGLVADGLFADEARAMVDTWERSYFTTEGLRLLYVLPRAWTDSLLPITIDPVPDELVRTLVGRIEILTPDDVDAMVAQVESWYAAPDTADEIYEMDGMAEPRLRAACHRFGSDDSPLAVWCANLIAMIYDTDL